MAERGVVYDRVYRGRMNPALRGKLCRVTQTWRGKAPHNVEVEFADGTRTICPLRCLRRTQ